MRALKSAYEGLTEALIMLKVVERGGSYNTADWYARMLKLESFITDEKEKEYMHEMVKFDLAKTKTKK